MRHHRDKLAEPINLLQPRRSVLRKTLSQHVELGMNRLRQAVLLLKRRDENRSLLTLFLIASIAILLFYAAGLMYGQKSNLVTTEYWRWWVVHLWVEGFFEVFATVVIAFLFTRLKLLPVESATRAVLSSTVIFLSGGIIGTFHHLYFTGAPNSLWALDVLNPGLARFRRTRAHEM